MDKIVFNRPSLLDSATKYLEDVIASESFENSTYTKQSSTVLEELTQAKKALLTNSCTSALELAAILLELKSGDEVILPSYTFVSTASAFVLRGATPVFVDVRPDTLNIDENLIEKAITEKTKAVIVVHYAGVGCEMDEILAIANKHNLFVIEDAAQGIMASYKGRPLGSIGHLASLSFHHTKNITAGLGGALLINDEKFVDRAKVIWQKGTNREAFLEGKVDKYTWVDVGSSFMPSELTAAMLFSQLESIKELTHRRLEIWQRYFSEIQNASIERFPTVPEYCAHNAHIFYLILKEEQGRPVFIKYMSEKGIDASFHYVPLHLSPAGKKFGRCGSDLNVTEDIAKRIVRLPLYSRLSDEQVDEVIAAVNAFQV